MNKSKGQIIKRTKAIITREINDEQRWNSIKEKLKFKRKNTIGV